MTEKTKLTTELTVEELTDIELEIVAGANGHIAGGGRQASGPMDA